MPKNAYGKVKKWRWGAAFGAIKIGSVPNIIDTDKTIFESLYKKFFSNRIEENIGG